MTGTEQEVIPFDLTTLHHSTQGGHTFWTTVRFTLRLGLWTEFGMTFDCGHTEQD